MMMGGIIIFFPFPVLSLSPIVPQSRPPLEISSSRNYLIVESQFASEPVRKSYCAREISRLSKQFTVVAFVDYIVFKSSSLYYSFYGEVLVPKAGSIVEVCRAFGLLTGRMLRSSLRKKTSAHAV